jgi:hypothetical protein
MAGYNEDDISRIVATAAAAAATAAAETAVRETFLALGIDISNPAAVVQAQLDFKSMRTSRELSDLIVKYGVGAIVTTVAGGALAMAWLGLKAVFSHP